MPTEILSKICTKCKIEKSLKEFNKSINRQDGKQTVCRKCEAEYRNKNREIRNKKNAEYYQKNKEQRKKSNEKWFDNNIEKAKKYRAEYRKNNKDKVKEYQIKNKDRIKELSKNWKDNNKEKVRCMSMEFRAKRRTVSDGTVTVKAIRELHEAQNGLCIYCQTKLKDDYHRDHIEPIAKGGIHSISNVQLLCPYCNMSKGAKDPKEYAKSIGRLF